MQHFDLGALIDMYMCSVHSCVAITGGSFERIAILSGVSGESREVRARNC